MFDRDPLLTVWTAIDPATKENGCVAVISGSHRYGVLDPSHPYGNVKPDQYAEHCPADKVVQIELKAGEAVLLHNWTIHNSGPNSTNRTRRGFSVCYCDSRTYNKEKPTPDGSFGWMSRVFGEGALKPEQLEPVAVA